MSRETKRSGAKLSLWILQNWDEIEPYLSDFHFYLNCSPIPSDMHCIFEGYSKKAGIAIYETDTFHKLYLERMSQPFPNRIAVFTKKEPAFNPFSISCLLNRPVQIL